MSIQRYAFNTGEFSPQLHYRSDLDKYRAASTLLENFLVNPQGSISTRPGTESIAKLNNESDTWRIIAFPITTSSSYILIFNGKGIEQAQCDIWLDDRKLVTIDCPYQANELDELQYFQSYDVIFLFHPNYPVQRFERLEQLGTTITPWDNLSGAFQITPHVFNGGPFESQNINATNILSINANQWNVSGTYNLGDVVSKGTTYTLTGSSTNEFLRTETNKIGKRVVITDFYGTKIFLTTTPTVTVGDNFTITGLSDLAGDWAVINVDTTNNSVTLNTGTKFVRNSNEWVNNFDGTNINGDEAYIQGQKFEFYTSNKDGNTGEDPTVVTSGWIASDYATGNVTITANYDAFNINDDGRKIRINSLVSTSDRGKWETTDEGAFTKVLPAYGTVTLKTEGGIWDGEVVLQQSIDYGVTWEDIGVIESFDGTANGVITREISTFGAIVRGYLRERGIATSDSGCIYYLDVTGNQYSYFTVTSVIDNRTVEVTVDNAIWSWISTFRHALGVFCDTNGYPSTGTLFEERLVLGGVPSEPMNLYMSAINDFEDWILGSFETSSIAISLPSSIRQSLKWMLSKQELLLGTDGGEWTVGSRGIDQALSSINIRAKQHSSVGSKSIQAVNTKEDIIFVERTGKAVRSMGYEFTKEGYITTDLSILASHLTKNSEIRDIIYSAGSTPILWVLLEDGNLLAFSYERNQNVSAWTRHDISGNVISLTADTSNNIWMVVQRGTKYLLERIKNDNEHIDSYEQYFVFKERSFYPQRLSDTKIWTNDWNEDNTSLFGTGSFIQTSTAVGNFGRVEFDGVNLNENVDYITTFYQNAGVYNHWFPTSGVNTSAVFYDTSNNIIPPSAYTIYNATDATTFEIYDTQIYGILWDEVTVLSGGVPLTFGSDYWPTTGGSGANNRVGIIFNSNPEDIEVIVRQNTSDEYTVEHNRSGEIMKVVKLFTPPRTFAPLPYRYFGLSQNSKMITTDFMADPQMGGPGSTSRISEIELYVYDSIGGEFRISTDNGFESMWQPVYDVPPSVILGEQLPPYTGKKIIPINSGYQQNGTFLEVQTNNPQHMNIAHIGIVAKKYK